MFGSTIISGLLSGSPTVPTITTLTASGEQSKAVSANTSNLSSIESLASQYNSFNQSQIESMLAAAIPGYSTIKSEVSSNIESLLQGNVPSSDAASQQLKSVSQAFNLGTTSSSSTGNLVARDLGLSQVSLMEQGISSAESWLTTMNSIEGSGSGQMFDMSSMFVTPSQTMSLDENQQSTNFQRDWTSNVIDWESSTGYLAGSDLSSTTSAISSTVGSTLGSSAGSSSSGSSGGSL